MKRQKQNQTPSPPKTTKAEERKSEGKRVNIEGDTKPKVSIGQSQTPKASISKDPPKVIKGILKKPKVEGELNQDLISEGRSRSQTKSVQMSSGTKEPKKPAERNSSGTPMSSVSTYQQLNQQHLSTQNVDSAFIEYLKIHEDMAARGEIEEAIKNLEEGLNERLGLYPAKDPGVWLISKLLADIGIRMAVRSLNSEKLDKANYFLKLARKHTEPLPNSDWNENSEWMNTRMNVFKNLALYQQKKEEWEKALDCFKVALKLEKDLKQNTANTSLTCAVILSRLNKYAESIDFAQNCMTALEQQMGIDRNKPLAEYKQFEGKTTGDYDKNMTTYAITLHLLGKNLANLKYVKEAKVFLSKAQYVSLNMLTKPKQDLQLAITNDLNNLNKNYKNALNQAKNKTNEEIENSLVTIKTSLANTSYSQADIQEQKALVGTVTNGPPIKTVKKEDNKKGKKKGAKSGERAIDAEDDDDTKVIDFVKRFADEKRKKENQQLDEYHRRVQQDFDEKQKEFMMKQQKNKFEKPEVDPNKPQYKSTGQFQKDKPKETRLDTLTKSLDKLSQPRARQKVTKPGEAPPPDPNKEEEERLQRVKKATMNPAAEGAKMDKKGIKYSSEKGNKNFFDKRKQNIERVNERLGLGSGTEGFDDSMEEIKGGTGNEEEAKKFDLSLPPIKGYKLDSLGLGQAGERVLQKYEGYQSDQSQNERSKRMLNAEDPSTKRLLQTIEGQYRKSLPSSVKKYAEDDFEDKEGEEIKEPNPLRDASGQIKDMPKYQPPKEKDWRQRNVSDTEDELPDAKKALEKLKMQGGVVTEDATAKLSLYDGDQTKYEETKGQPVVPTLNEAKLTEAEKKQRSVVLSKPPKSSVNLNTTVKEEKAPEPVKKRDVKTKLSGSLGRNLGMTSKGSPRPTDQEVNESMNAEQEENATTTKNSRGLRGKQSGSKQPSQGRNQYMSPADKRKAKSKEPNVPWGGPDSDERRQKRLQNQERLNQLAQPRPGKYVLVKEEEEDEEDQRLKMFRDQVDKGKDINFSEYVAREVPYIKNNVKGLDGKTGPTGTFDTKMNNKTGLFTEDAKTTKNKGQNDQDIEVKYIQDKKGRNTLKDRRGPNLVNGPGGPSRNTIDTVGDFMSKGTDDSKGTRKLGTKKIQNMPGMRSIGAKSAYAVSGTGNLSLKELRQMEYAAAQYVQKIVRGYFTRKWYLNYKVRQRLGVPFSGLEFTSNSFLRQFNKPNLQLQELALVPPTVVEIVNKQSAQKNMIQRKINHSKFKKDKFGGGTELSDVEQAREEEEDQVEDIDQQPENKVVPRRIPKGATPEQLLNTLQKNFLAQGLDAYSQFKRLGAGIDHDDEGKEVPQAKKVGTEKNDLADELKKLEAPAPKWRESNQGFLDVGEVDQYIQKTKKAKSSKKDEDKKEDQKQEKQNFVTSLAAFASIHGVFKKSDAAKREEQDAGGEEGDDIQTLLKKRRQVDEDEDYFPVEKYQDFSREVISFYKKIGDFYIKWTVYVGLAFKKEKKFFIPVKILGEPLKSRSTIVSYVMNLELLKISRDIDKNFEFETVWPFILYLFNNWVRHQVKLMGLMDQRPELKGVFSQTEAAMYEVKEFDKSLLNAKEEYNDMLNFSSEIEFDERFDMEKYSNDKQPDKLMDRSKPKEHRKNPIQQMKHNRKELFNAYKQKINIYEQLMQMEDDDRAIMDYDEEGRLKKKVRLQLEDIYEPVETRKKNPFEYFLKMHFVSLPKTNQGQYKLLQNLQAKGYAEIVKKNGLIEEAMAIMNEERRKRKGLPPLQILDYNCIDRAALKLKTIIECLYLRRQMNGWCLIPRDVKESLKVREWQLRKEKFRAIACRMQNLSPQLLKFFGMHIEIPKQYNERALQVEASMKKIQEYKSRHQITIKDVDQEDDKHLSATDSKRSNRFKELDDEVLLRQSQDKKGDTNRQTPGQERNIQHLDSKVKNKMVVKAGGEAEEEEEPEKMIQRLEQDAIGKLMDLQKTHQEVEDFLRENEILEQGVIQIEDNQYIMTLIFKRIKSNYENMRALIDERVRRFTKEDDDQEENKQEIMKSRICEYVSIHPQVTSYDDANHSDIKEMEKIDIEQEKFMKKRTIYKSYAEVKICSRIDRMNWDDSFNVNWETVEDFFKKFGQKWKPEEFLGRRRLNGKQRFTFYNFFSKFLFIQDCRVHVDINRFDVEYFKFNHIFLNLDQIKKDKDEHNLYFYYDDYLDNKFDDASFDYAIFPFYEDPRLIEHFMSFEKEDVYFKYDPVHEDQIGNSATIQIVEQKKKPDLLIDDKTKAYISDPNNNFNLTLSNFPQSDGIYLGKIMITGNDGYKNPYNLRIDYYVLGYTQTLQIKAFNTLHDEVFDLKITNKKIIKDVIRICRQSQESMVTNQLQSMISLNRKLNGSYLKLNFNIRRDKNINLGQNYINMLICNEKLLRSMQKDNYRQFQGIVYFENFGGRMLVTVTEFEIEVEQISQNDTDLQLIHGNKHLPIEHIKEINDKGKIRTLLVPKKRFQKLRLWKVNIFNIFTSKNYDALVSYDDLINYYESELFQFYSTHPNMVKPNLVYLLQDYIRNLFIYKSRVGSILYWKLPYFKRPLDENGMYKNVSGDQLYQLKLLDVYHTLQKRIEEQNKEEDNNALPFSLDQMKAKRNAKEPPSLSLRNKLILEKELPIYHPKDSRVLKLTSSTQEVIVQVPKVFKSLLSIQYCIITVTLYPLMECWMWQIYFLRTQRTFTVTFYPSDLFNMDQEILNFQSAYEGKNPATAKGSASGLWIELIKRADLLQNPSGDILLTCETFREPLKEILFQDHVFNENAMDIFFMEVAFKSYSNYVTDVRYAIYPMDLETDEVNDYTISIRAFSLTRNVWVKDYQPLAEVVRILKAEKYLTNNVKLLYYSMLRDAATLLAHKIVFSDEAKTTEIKKKKLTYDIRQLLNNKDMFQKLQEEARDPPQPDKKKRTDKQKRKDESVLKSVKLDDTHELIEKDPGLRPEWKNQIELNKIIYQGVASQNPVQVYTIIYNDVKDLFIYRLYRISDSSTYEKRLPGYEVQKTCAPNYKVMIRNKMVSQLGERIGDYYKTNMIVASLMSYYNLKK